MYFGSTVFLRAMYFTSNLHQRCNNNVITFLLLTSSAHSVEQLHHSGWLPAISLLIAAPFLLLLDYQACDNIMPAYAGIFCQFRELARSARRMTSKRRGCRSDLTMWRNYSIVHDNTVFRTINHIPVLSFKQASASQKCVCAISTLKTLNCIFVPDRFHNKLIKKYSASPLSCLHFIVSLWGHMSRLRR